MDSNQHHVDSLLTALRERAKELSCLYSVEELFNRPGITLPEIVRGIVEAIPPGWQYPEICRAFISYGGESYFPPDFAETPWVMRADIVYTEHSLWARILKVISDLLYRIAFSKTSFSTSITAITPKRTC